ncbi:hypothetical protein HETIRDRAFT_436575 [Heterobasidion irregulare TC 32-1]|uniref:Uncharacterized protein n=1 Tax=Heterobasidion irregulare (strain TC 32-1) TaxID=747525 RepID=W4JSX3_HETIT|nr:uncharacterized protein HETIRDRAFT_436575 [Heterobasidion irregulare TC 32-1]ETW76662.1 hypothetical protein HETIRDRAFT_436575 [Heterobasidion irregulare TC 32-1]
MINVSGEPRKIGNGVRGLKDVQDVDGRAAGLAVVDDIYWCLPIRATTSSCHPLRLTALRSLSWPRCIAQRHRTIPSTSTSIDCGIEATEDRVTQLISACHIMFQPPAPTRCSSSVSENNENML